MINKRTIFEIHRLKDMQFSIRQIAKTLNLDRGTVARYIKHPDITCKPRRGRPSKLDPFREFIKEMVEQYPKVNAPVVLRQIKNKGFDGEITIVRKYLKVLKYNTGRKQAFIRFESQPGQQIQIDWGHFGSLVYDGSSRKLMYGKGNFLFMGDTHQLPPIIMGDYENMGDTLNLNQSILENFKDMYPGTCQVELNVTYRMNKEICAFPNRMWYRDRLKSAPANADARLLLKELSDPVKNSVEKPVENQKEKHELDQILNPQNPLTLVLTDHFGCSQKSDTEVGLMAKLACRLILDYGVSPKKMALISPHRAQNNAIAVRLENKLICENKRKITLPVVDTIERIQGAQRDIIIFGLTCSDPDYLLTDFLNNPNRLNVAMTRAKTKLIIIGSDLFFSAIPDSELMLKKNRCFKELLEYCRKKNICFSWRDGRDKD